MLNFGLSGQTILVTGGGSGIGRATALAAAKDGCKVGIADINRQAAESVASEITSAGGKALALAFDITNPAATEAALADLEGHFQSVSLVVASAGISRPQPAEQMSQDHWDPVIATNLTGVFLSLQIVGRRLLQTNRGGAMVAIASVDGLGGHSARTNYVASKFGVIGLVKSLAIEWGRRGIRVNAVAPGVVDTPLLRRNIPEAHVEGVMLDRTPLGRFCNAEEVASASLFLLSAAASYVNGTVLTVDGGLSAGFFTHEHGADFGSRALLAK